MKKKIALTIACLLVIILLLSLQWLKHEEKNNDEVYEDIYDTMVEAINID